MTSPAAPRVLDFQGKSAATSFTRLVSLKRECGVTLIPTKLENGIELFKFGR